MANENNEKKAPERDRVTDSFRDINDEYDPIVFTSKLVLTAIATGLVVFSGEQYFKKDDFTGIDFLEKTDRQIPDVSTMPPFSWISSFYTWFTGLFSGSRRTDREVSEIETKSQDGMK